VKHTIASKTLLNVAEGDLPNIRLQNTRRNGNRTHDSSVQEHCSYHKALCL